MTLSRLHFFSSILLVALSFFSTVKAADSKAGSWYQEAKESNSGTFLVTLDSNSSAAKLNEFQDWLLTVTHKETGEVVSPARITVGGGMSMHGHGLPTQPQVTEYLGDGQYKLEGLQFNMNGKWVLEFEIVTADATDTVVFNMVLDY